MPAGERRPDRSGALVLLPNSGSQSTNPQREQGTIPRSRCRLVQETVEAGTNPRPRARRLQPFFSRIPATPEFPMGRGGFNRALPPRFE